MPACEGQPVRLPLESGSEASDLEGGATARSGAARVPGARAAALLAVAAAAALVLFAAAGRSAGAAVGAGRSAGAAVGAGREAVVSMSSTEECAIYGFSNVVHYGATDFKKLSLDAGWVWLVQSDTIHVQGLFGGLMGGTVLKEVTIGGPSLQGGAVHIRAHNHTWYPPTGSAETILVEDVSDFSIPGEMDLSVDHDAEKIHPSLQDSAVHHVTHAKIGEFSMQIQCVKLGDNSFVAMKLVKPVESPETGLCTNDEVSVVPESDNLFAHHSPAPTSGDTTDGTATVDDDTGGTASVDDDTGGTGGTASVDDDTGGGTTASTTASDDDNTGGGTPATTTASSDGTNTTNESERLIDGTNTTDDIDGTNTTNKSERVSVDVDTVDTGGAPGLTPSQIGGAASVDTASVDDDTTTDKSGTADMFLHLALSLGFVSSFVPFFL